MNNYFGQNYPPPPGPGYPPNQPSYGGPNQAPYPIGFTAMPAPNFEPYQSNSSSFYPPPQSSPYPPPPQNGSGFPIAPPGGYSSYPPPPPQQYGPGPGYPPPPQSNYPPSSAFNQSPYQGGPPPPANYPQPYQQPGGYPPPPMANNYPGGAPYSGQPQPQPLPTQSGPNLYPNINQFNTGSTSFVPQQALPATIPSNPVLRPHQPFNPNEDATKLYKAMKGFGTDEAALIEILCKRTSQQREQIALSYKSSYGKDLQRNIESETSGEFRDVLVALVKRPIVYEAECLRDSIAGLGTNESTLIDIVCTKSNTEMMALKNTYKQMYNRNLEEDVKDDVSGYFKRLLVSLMTGNRLENQPADYNKAIQQAKELLAAGEKRMGTDEVVFNRIFSTESHQQLRLVFDEYQKLTRHPIENAIRGEMSSSVQQAYLTLITYIRSPAGFFAQRLNDSMRGLGTRDNLLIRICVLRSEIDMQDIKMEFQKRFGRSLETWIRSDCSGDYRRALLCLIGDPKWK